MAGIAALMGVGVVLTAALVVAALVSTVFPPPPASSKDVGPVFAVSRPGASATKVFAHYFPPYPISLDNKAPTSDYYATQYLDPAGEGGVHEAYGGLLRDRPIGRAPRAGDWKLADLESEVREASSAGIDGFTVDVLSYSGSNWDQTVRLEQAAERVGDGFVVVPNLDMTTSSGRSDVSTTASRLAQLFGSSAAYRLSDGRYVLSTFEAEARSPTWWAELESVMAERYGIHLALISVLLDASDANLRDYAPVSYMLSSWGARDVDSIGEQSGKAALAKRLHVKWMEPIAVQDERPSAGLYAEADNTELLRSSWQQAIDERADAVQLVTWNDYSEGTQIAPSVEHGWVFLDICAYYIDWLKRGSAPGIDGDALYVTYRTQFAAAVPTSQEQLMQPTLSGSMTAPRDDVEVLTFLSQPGDVTVTVGGRTTSYRAPAGVSAKLVPLAVGQIAARLSRDGSPVLDVSASPSVKADPAVQDLDYHAVGASARHR